MHRGKTSKIFAYVSIGVFAVCLATLIIFYALDLFGTLASLVIVLIVLASLALILFSSFMVIFINHLTLDHMLMDENEYSLGIRNTFNNLSTFIHNASMFRSVKSNQKKPQYVIAFTASAHKTVRNYQRNENILRLNLAVANILEEVMSEEKLKNKRITYLTALDKGTFFIFTIGLNDEGIKALAESIKKKISTLTEEEFRVWIEPIFGYVEVKNEGFIGEYIDNAVLARNVSERNFENVVEYRDSFRRSVSKNDTDEIIEGLKNDEFVVYYQPKFDLNEKKFTSSEALVRWNSKKYGLLPPGKFLATAEAAGLIHEIDKFVFIKVCEFLNETKRRGHRMLPVSVNFSLYEFFSTKFLDEILELIEKYEIDTSLIQIEITEGTSMANQFLSVSIIKKLQERGIKILMDDFGVGFSNIGNLKKIPFDSIKIDKSFIDNIDHDQNDAELVKLLINSSKVYGLEVIAEGVDNAKQVEILKKFKCDVIQGYYYSKPIPKKEYEAFLRNNPFETQAKGDRR